MDEPMAVSLAFSMVEKWASLMVSMSVMMKEGVMACLWVVPMAP
jgi:hypothetical protein